MGAIINFYIVGAIMAIAGASLIIFLVLSDKKNH